MKTAVEILEQKLDNILYGDEASAFRREIFEAVETAKDIERLQLIHANEDGRQTVVDLIIDYADTNPEELIRRFFHGNYSLREEAEEYFNKTYTCSK